jgi:hypothetical protein
MAYQGRCTSTGHVYPQHSAVHPPGPGSTRPIARARIQAADGSKRSRGFASLHVTAGRCNCARVPPGLLDGAAIAHEIRHVRPDVPIVMLADRAELPGGALKCIDAVVANSDEPHLLLATVHFVLNVKPRASVGHRPRRSSRRVSAPEDSSRRTSERALGMEPFHSGQTRRPVK